MTSSGGEPRLPPLRNDLEMEETENGLFVFDPLQNRRFLFRGSNLELLKKIRDGSEVTPDGIRSALPDLSPELIRNYLLMFTQDLFFEGPRWRDQAALFQEARDAEAGESRELPLEFHESQRHQCIACGSSCFTVDIAPVEEHVERAVTEHELWREVEDAQGVQDVFETIELPDRQLKAMARSREQCVMLSEDFRCLIHERAGAEVKPGICREFPWRFVRGREAVYASLSMECRSYLEAKRAGMDQAEGAHRAELETLSNLRGDPAKIPDPVHLAPGLVMREEEYLEIESRALEIVSASEEIGLPRRTFARIAALIVDRARERQAAYADSEAYLDPAHWPVTAENGAHLETESAEAMFPRFMEWVAKLSKARERTYLDREKRKRTIGLSLSTQAAVGLGGGIDLRGPYWSEQRSGEIFRDALISYIWGKEVTAPLDLVWGVARLGLKLFLADAVARLRAVEVSRYPMYAQDAVDALVLLSFDMRDGDLHSFLTGKAGTLRWLFAGCAENVAGQSGPAPREAWMGIDRLRHDSAKAR